MAVITIGASTRDLERLRGCHPDLIRAYEKLAQAMELLGAPIFVTSGLRTLEQQQALYAQGRTAPGPKVTNADGVKARSNHQAHPDGFGHAFDIAFAGESPFDDRHPWALAGAIGKHLGLRWGGDWRPLVDRPHFELA